MLGALARVETELLGEDGAGAAVRGECVCLSLAAVERDHELAPEAFAQRLFRDEALELGHELGVAAEAELGFDPLFQAGQAKRVQALSLEREDAAVAAVRESRPTPERERRPQAILGETGGAANERVPPSRRSRSKRRASSLSGSTSRT